MTHVKNYSMTVFKSMAMLMLAAFTFVSCKKNKDSVTPPATVAVEGSYTGKYGFGNDMPDTDQKYKIKAGGIFQEIGVNSNTVIGEGTWQMNGNTLTAKYTMNFSPYSKYSISATFDAATGKLVGTWGGENNPADGGKINMTKQ